MSKEYKIYHIPGVKIGVSVNPIRRMRRQNNQPYEILETHTDIIKVSEREIELQKEYGYKIDTIPYYIFVNGKNQVLGGFANGGKGGHITTSKKEWKAIRESGTIASVNSSNFMSKQRRICEYCNSETNPGNYTRWHGDNCKHKK